MSATAPASTSHDRKRIRLTAAELVTRAEETLHVAGHLARARTEFGRAFDQAEHAGDLRLVARAALGLSGMWIHERRSAATAAAVEVKQRQTVARLHPESSHALRLRIRLAADADFQSGSTSHVGQLLDEARAGGHPLAIAEALNLAHHCMLSPEYTHTRLQLAEELLRVGASTGRPSDVVMGMIWRAADLFLMGDRQAQRAFVDLLSHEPAQRNAFAAFTGEAMQVMLTIRAGRLDDAEALSETCARAGASAGHPEWMSWYTAQLAAIRWYQGRIGELTDTLATVVRSPRLSAADTAFVALQALACAAAGETREAHGALARLVAADLADLPRSNSWLATMSILIEAAALLGDAGVVQRAYTLLLPFADLPVVMSTGVACFGSAQYPLGVAAMMLDDADRAAGHFEAAVAHNSALAHWPAVTLSRYRLAQVRPARTIAGPLPPTAALLDECVCEASDLGMSLPAPIVRLHRPPPEPPVCTRRGRRWRIEAQGRTAMVDDMVGLRHLATLLANPGVDIPAVELADPHPDSHRPVDQPMGQPVLDGTALRQYRARLGELARLIEGAEGNGNTESARALRSESEWLTREIRSSTGLGGRSRTFADNAERARIAVGKAIRRALERVTAIDAVIGEQMRAGVETGTLCRYRHDAD